MFKTSKQKTHTQKIKKNTQPEQQQQQQQTRPKQTNK